MVARLRVSTSGTGGVSDDYANGAPTVGQLLTSGGAGNPPTWGAAPAGVRPVNRVLFVDAINSPGVGSTGTLAAPFQTLQQAINQAVVNGWDTVQLQIASATYAAPVAIPVTLTQVSLVGWDDLEVPILGGDITYTTDPLGLTGTLQISKCIVTAANIRTANVATQSLNVQLRTCSNSAAVAANNLLIDLIGSTQVGNATGTTGLFTLWDDYSWATTLAVAPTFAPAYSRQFRGSGHDTYARALVANGVPLFPAVGSTVFVNMAVPAYVRADDVAEIIVLDPTIQDFICGVHGTAAGVVTAWITNLSRVSTNFAEAIKLLIHHETMQAEPPP